MAAAAAAKQQTLATEKNKHGAPQQQPAPGPHAAPRLTLGAVIGRSGDKARPASVAHVAFAAGLPGAAHAAPPRLVAVKRFLLDDVDDLEELKELSELIRHEVCSMRQLRHANLLPCLAAIVAGAEVQVMSPLMAFGSARDLIVSHFGEGLPEKAVGVIVRDVLAALDYLHVQGIVHRSVRASHILISELGGVRLSGLRYSCSLLESGAVQDRYDYPLHVASTNLNWMSPEMLQQNLLGYNEKSDIFSLSVTVCEMSNGRVPFSEMPGTLMFLEKLRGATPKLLDRTTFHPAAAATAAAAAGESLAPHEQAADSGVGASVGSCTNMAAAASATSYSRRQFSESFHAFVDAASAPDPVERPTAAKLRVHPFCKQARRSGVSLPSLLDPVMPLTHKCFEPLQDKEVASDLVIGALRQVSVDGSDGTDAQSDVLQWDF